MARFDHPILEEVSRLRLPYPEEVIINHGSALVVRGIREEHDDGDIDFSTCLENIQYLREILGWRAVRMVVGVRADGSDQTIIATKDNDDRFDGHRWTFSMPRYLETGKGRIYLAEQGARSEQDERSGLWVASLELVRETKELTGRTKDEEDIALIDSQLRQ